MKKIETLFLTFAALMAPITACAETPPTTISATTQAPTTSPATTQAAAPLSPLEAIRQAPDPSAAVQAYAAAATAEKDTVLVEQAYVHRMIDLGAPEMADAQAQDLVRRGVNDVGAQGVAGYMAAARGQIGPAANLLRAGLSQAGDDPFLLRTAAQIVAWYDTTTDRSNLSKDDVKAVEWLRSAGANKGAFADAYRVAMDTRRGIPGGPGGAPTTQPATESTSAMVPPQQTGPAEAPYSYYYDSSVVVGPSYPPYYGGYWGGYWPWWGSTIIIRDHDFCDRIHHHGFVAENRFAGHRFEGAGGAGGAGGFSPFVGPRVGTFGHSPVVITPGQSTADALRVQRNLDILQGRAGRGAAPMGPMPSSATPSRQSAADARPTAPAPAPARAPAPSPSRSSGGSSAGMAPSRGSSSSSAGAADGGGGGGGSRSSGGGGSRSSGGGGGFRGGRR